MSFVNLVSYFGPEKNPIILFLSPVIILCLSTPFLCGDLLFIYFLLAIPQLFVSCFPLSTHFSFFLFLMYYHKHIFLYSLYLPNFRFTLIPWYPSLSSSLFPLTSPLKKQNSLLKIPDEFPLVSFKPKDSAEILKLTLVFHKFLSTVLDIHFSLLHFPASVLHSPGTTFCLLSRGQHGFADFGGWAAF